MLMGMGREVSFSNVLESVPTFHNKDLYYSSLGFPTCSAFLSFIPNKLSQRQNQIGDQFCNGKLSMISQRSLANTIPQNGKLWNSSWRRKRMVAKASSGPSSVTTLVLAVVVPLLLAGSAALAGVFLLQKIEIEAMLEAEEMERLKAEGLLKDGVEEAVNKTEELSDNETVVVGARNRPRREE